MQKHVTVLHRAGLVAKRRRGREQLVSGRVEALRTAGELLDSLETVWRERHHRMSELLAEPAEATSPACGADNPTNL